MIMKKPQNILIVEDDNISAAYLQAILEKNGYIVVGIVDKGADAIQQARDKKPDLVLMDILLKDNIRGCDAALQINQNNPNIAIVFLTAYAEDAMIELALQSNARAYLMKPYNEREILATIRVILSLKQKENLSSSSNIIKLKNDFSFDLETLMLEKSGKQIPLTPNKNRLIEVLVRHINTTISHKQLCLFIWGEFRETGTLRTLVYRTKQEVGEDLITNLNGVGYSITSK